MRVIKNATLVQLLTEEGLKGSSDTLLGFAVSAWSIE